MKLRLKEGRLKEAWDECVKRMALASPECNDNVESYRKAQEKLDTAEQVLLQVILELGAECVCDGATKMLTIQNDKAVNSDNEIAGRVMGLEIVEESNE